MLKVVYIFVCLYTIYTFHYTVYYETLLTSNLFERGCGKNVVVMNAEDFAQLLAQIIEFLQTLFNHLFSLRHILSHRGFVLSDAGCTLSLKKFNLQWSIVIITDFA